MENICWCCLRGTGFLGEGFWWLMTILSLLTFWLDVLVGGDFGGKIGISVFVFVELNGMSC